LVVMVALAVASTIAGVAQAQVEVPQWGGGTVAERVIGWIGELWNAVAGAKAEPAAPADGGGTDGVAPDGPELTSTSGDPSTETNVYPEFDPDG
jgi:hypothetical protein